MGREFLCGEESICGQSLMRVWGHAPTENVRCSEIISVAPYKTHIIQEPKIKYGVDSSFVKTDPGESYSSCPPYSKSPCMSLNL